MGADLSSGNPPPFHDQTSGILTPSFFLLPRLLRHTNLYFVFASLFSAFLAAAADTLKSLLLPTQSSRHLSSSSCFFFSSFLLFLSSPAAPMPSPTRKHLIFTHPSPSCHLPLFLFLLTILCSFIVISASSFLCPSTPLILCSCCCCCFFLPAPPLFGCSCSRLCLSSPSYQLFTRATVQLSPEPPQASRAAFLVVVIILIVVASEAAAANREPQVGCCHCRSNHPLPLIHLLLLPLLGGCGLSEWIVKEGKESEFLWSRAERSKGGGLSKLRLAPIGGSKPRVEASTKAGGGLEGGAPWVGSRLLESFEGLEEPHSWARRPCPMGAGAHESMVSLEALR
ncbi:hypothetical protein CRG98_045440 [Punica granatum]|uniref:Uncharacterized protein n=1 Tax=Punica granatum TaxID=22663 RepID=A0A2I0HR18_PUNGR|nr:hypothetical protein CRG98_045440 [Punica granatum]